MPLPLPTLHQAIVDYCYRRGILVPTLDWPNLRTNPSIARDIARLHKAAPLVDERALPAYEALRKEIVPQIDLLTRPVADDGLGVTVERQDTEPYDSSVQKLLDEVCTVRNVQVLASEADNNPHPFFTYEEQDQFQALHEVFGHAVIQRGYDFDGCVAAWLRHSLMFSPLARKAMTTETLGMTCALLYTRLGDDPPPNKVMVLPAMYSEPDYERWR